MNAGSIFAMKVCAYVGADLVQCSRRKFGRSDLNPCASIRSGTNLSASNIAHLKENGDGFALD